MDWPWNLDDEDLWNMGCATVFFGFFAYSMVSTFLYGPPHDQIAEAKQKKVLEERLVPACKNGSPLHDKCIYLIKEAGFNLNNSYK